jgi:clan AA aspartic protease
MRSIRAVVAISSSRGRRVVRRDALVDTGASLTVIPRELARRVGIAPGKTVPVRLAGGRTTRMPVATAFIRLDGRETPSTVLIAPGGDVLLGAETLELLGASVDLKRRRLKLSPKVALMAA